MVTQKTIERYTKFVGLDFGCIHVDSIEQIDLIIQKDILQKIVYLVADAVIK